MHNIDQLLTNNQAWAEQISAQDPTFFARLAAQQAPDYLWIGCADSRVPATQLVGLLPGEMFVHRNVANLVVHSDLNCLAVLHYAVDVLKVGHVMVVGHYGCGGVEAALNDRSYGLIDNWLRHVQDVRNKHSTLLDTCQDDQQRWGLMCELNVIEQVVNVCQTTIVQSAWRRGQPVAVHGLIYGLADGLLRHITQPITQRGEIAERYALALQMLP